MLERGTTAGHIVFHVSADRISPQVNFISPGLYRSPDYFDLQDAKPLIGVKFLDRALRGVEQSDLSAYRLDQQPVGEVLASIRSERQVLLQSENLPFAEFLASHRLVARQACSVRSR